MKMQALRKSPDSVAVLDNRAATYTKLTKYDLALRDARHMIKNDRNDERVYTWRQIETTANGVRDTFAAPRSFSWMGSPKRHWRCMPTG